MDITTDAARNHPPNGFDSSSPAGRSATDVYNHLTSRAQIRDLDISDEKVAIPSLKPSDLPHCPQCNTGLLRPGVVWFGEMLPEKTIRHVDEWITSAQGIDLIMVIGTSARVYPAAGYVQRARAKGAKVAVVNTDVNDAPDGGMMKGDWFFVGDAGVVVPEMLRPVVGDLDDVAAGERL